ncbi:MAG: hypothetical protein IJZ03_09105 [Clostridia bacterium]|nr:hypothetical protein [Clostridia bacterium]MBQ8743508.1 hypothetical protein [Clostridia bacterium]
MKHFLRILYFALALVMLMQAMVACTAQGGSTATDKKSDSKDPSDGEKDEAEPIVLQLTGKREVFWDDYLLDTENTTATHVLHQPTEAGVAITHDLPWEGNATDYHCIVQEPDGLLRMYYLGWNLSFSGGVRSTPINVCYAESRDGIVWEKPELDIATWDGQKTNIIIDGRTSDAVNDGFFVFRDENPNCPAEELYKGLVRRDKANGSGQELWCYTSADAIHFKKGWCMTDKGWFDSLNTVIWDAESETYICYIRDFHGDEDKEKATRDVRYMYSSDFRTWSDPVQLDFMGKEDYPLYTNCISQYQRASQIYVGFPTRYYDRGEWSRNYSRLCGAEARLKRYLLVKRYGTTITDCVFMFSRDGEKWTRYDEAFMRPGPEYSDNWIYGDCYPANGTLVETAGKHGTESEISLYSMIGVWSEKNPAQLMRYTIRKDGFVSLNAPYSGAKITTKQFVFGGEGISINFSTSARGYVRITLTAEDGTVVKSEEIFGDSCDRIVDFDKKLSSLAGKKVVMEIEMRDADIYSVKFD